MSLNNWLFHIFTIISTSVTYSSVHMCKKKRLPPKNNNNNVQHRHCVVRLGVRSRKGRGWGAFPLNALVHGMQQLT